MHISLKAEKLAEIGPLVITNSMLTVWLTMLFVLGVAYLGTRKLKLVPEKFQSVLEMAVGGLFEFFNSIFEDQKQTKKYFTLVASFFILLLFCNWLGLLIELVPGVKYLGVMRQEGESSVFSPLFRSVNSDLNMTLSWAIISVFFIQFFGITSIGLKSYIHKFFNFSDPISFFVGVLELIGEMIRVISLSFRLFGNIFAGEVILVVIGGLAPLLAPIPFYGMELFVGFIQTLIFTMLSTVFMKIAGESEH